MTRDFGQEDGGGLAGGGSALVCVADPRVELAIMLVLQELDVSVDVVSDADTAIRWVRQARYDLVVAGGSGVAVAPLAVLLRHAGPLTRIILLTDDEDAAVGLDGLNVEVIVAPLDVNALMQGLSRAA